MTVRIEKASEKSFSALRRIELAAFETLRQTGALDGEPEASTDEELRRYLQDDLLHVALNDKGIPVGFGGGYMIGPWLHIAEVDVHPDWQRRGIGRSIVSALVDESRARHASGCTLTTDRLAPFNAPFYASMGFQVTSDMTGPEHLGTILQEEYTKGLDPDRRVAMHLQL